METDLRRVSAGCVPPNKAVWLYSAVKRVPDGRLTLNFQDPNDAIQRTGWNIRRSDVPFLPMVAWPLVGPPNMPDGDLVAPGYQWTDLWSADPLPGGVWYYQVTAYNANCPAEGPF